MGWFETAAQTTWPWCHTGVGGWMGWSVHLIGWVLVLGLIIWAVTYASRSGGGRVRTSTAAELLDERYARGELTTEEYRERKDTMR
jgi:putative membrane protein